MPSGERAIRTKLLAFIHEFDAPAARANLHVRLTSLNPPAYGAGPRPRWEWDAGDHSVLALIVVGNVILASYRERELGSGSYSNPQHLAQVNDAAMLHALEVVDEYGLDLLAGLSMVGYPLESHYGATFGETKKRPPRFDEAAAQMLLGAIIESHGVEKQPKLAGKAARWAKQALTATQLIAKLDPSKSWERGSMSDAQTSVAWLVVDYLQDAAFDVMFDWLLERPSPMVESNMHIVSEPVKALAKLYPKAGKAFLKRVETIANGKTKHAEAAGYLRDHLAD